MARKISLAVVLIVAAFAQCSLFQLFAIASIKPNLMVILVVSFGLMRGRRSGMLIGFWGGLIIDLFFPSYMGLEALLYMWLGWWAGGFYRLLYDDDIKTPLLLVAGADLMYGVGQYLFTFLLRGRIHFFFYLRRIIIPEILYTLVLTILIYRLIYRYNRWLERKNKRSIESLV